MPAAHRIARAATGHSPLAVDVDTRSGLTSSRPTSLPRRTIVCQYQRRRSRARNSFVFWSLSFGHRRLHSSYTRPAAGLYELESPNVQNRAGYSCLCCTRQCAALTVLRKLNPDLCALNVFNRIPRRRECAANLPVEQRF